MFGRKVRGVRLYSMTLSVILMSLSSWLAIYMESPEKASVLELQQIISDFEQVKKETDLNTNTNTNMNSDKTTLMAWLYPGEPACSALEDIEKTPIDVIKPEYFSVGYEGRLELLTADSFVCNGYSAKQVAKIKELSKQQFVTVSSSGVEGMETFLAKDANTHEHTEKLTNFVVDNDFSGVEIDFENYGQWTPQTVKKYMSFLDRLGKSLHAKNKKLMIDLPPVKDQVEADWYNFKLVDFNSLPVDYIVIMAYDYQYDHGVGQPVSPLTWLGQVIDFTKQQITDNNKIVIGLPAYGYKGSLDATGFSLLTHDQAWEESLFSKLKRDNASGELMAVENGEVLVVQDTESLNRKIQVVESRGLNSVSIWHLGGNKLP